jgi:hypothetical protein
MAGGPLVRNAITGVVARIFSSIPTSCWVTVELPGHIMEDWLRVECGEV